MKKELLTMVALFSALSMSADNNSKPITVTSGFNADVITLTEADAPTSQGAVDGHGSQLLSAAYPGISSSDNVMPISGKLTVSNGHVYQLGNYKANNALYIGISEANSHTKYSTDNGTIVFSGATACDTLGILVIGANRENYDIAFHVNATYTDGTTADLGSFKVSDWGQNNENDAVYTCTKRFRYDANSNPESGTYYISEVRVPLGGTKTLQSVKLTSECQDDAWGWGCLTFLGFTALTKAQATNIAPVKTGEARIQAVYGENGAQLSAPTKGVNIIKYTDGSVQKVIIK